MNNHYAVIGNPVLHSLSPLIHQRAFNYYQINARYFAYEVQDFSLFMEYFYTGKNHQLFQAYSYLENNPMLKKQTLTKYKEQDFTFPMQGLSITIPYKKNVLEVAQALTYRASLSGAANTLYWDNGQLTADNTDIQGFFAPIQEKIQQGKNFQSAIIYGAGGAARAVVAALLHCSAIKDIFLCARREEQVQECIKHFHSHHDLLIKYSLNTQAVLHYLPLIHKEFPCDIIINTIPQWDNDAQSPRNNFTNVLLAYDLTYKQTPFLLKANQSKIPTINGTKMFIEQAKAQFYLWTNKEIPAICYTDLF